MAFRPGTGRHGGTNRLLLRHCLQAISNDVAQRFRPSSALPTTKVGLIFVQRSLNARRDSNRNRTTAVLPPPRRLYAAHRVATQPSASSKRISSYFFALLYDMAPRHVLHPVPSSTENSTPACANPKHRHLAPILPRPLFLMTHSTQETSQRGAHCDRSTLLHPLPP